MKELLDEKKIDYTEIVASLENTEQMMDVILGRLEIIKTF